MVSGPEAEGPSDGALELPALPPGGPRAESRRRILVVDDNEFNRAVLARQVAALGYEAEQASDGEEALQLVEKGDYALILADCQMPGMDGFEFAREVRKAETSRAASAYPRGVDGERDARRRGRVPRRRHGRRAGQAVGAADRATRPPDVGGSSRRGGARPFLRTSRCHRRPPTVRPIDRMQLRAIMDGDAALEAEMLAGFRRRASRKRPPCARRWSERLRRHPARVAPHERAGPARRRLIPGVGVRAAGAPGTGRLRGRSGGRSG